MNQPQIYEIESNRLFYRKLRADDFSLVSPILQDEQNMYARRHAFTYDEVCDWIADMLHRYQQDGCGYFAAIDKESHELVGLAGLMAEHPTPDETTLVLGCLVRRSLWNQGFGTECAQTALHYAFDHLHAERVTAVIHPSDLPSLHVAAKCKMQVEGQRTMNSCGDDIAYVICTIDRESLLPPIHSEDSVPPMVEKESTAEAE